MHTERHDEVSRGVQGLSRPRRLVGVGRSGLWRGLSENKKKNRGGAGNPGPGLGLIPPGDDFVKLGADFL